MSSQITSLETNLSTIWLPSNVLKSKASHCYTRIPVPQSCICACCRCAHSWRERHAATTASPHATPTPPHPTGLTESQWLRDLPDAYADAKHQGDVIIGSLAQQGYGVTISAWSAGYSSGNVKIEVDQQFVHPEPVPGTRDPHCLPFSDVRISNHTTGIPAVYLNSQHTNIVLGISDPSIFDPPCTPSAAEVYWYAGSHHPEGAKTIATIAEIWRT